MICVKDVADLIKRCDRIIRPYEELNLKTRKQIKLIRFTTNFIALILIGMSQYIGYLYLPFDGRNDEKFFAIQFIKQYFGIIKGLFEFGYYASWFGLLFGTPSEFFPIFYIAMRCVFECVKLKNYMRHISSEFDDNDLNLMYDCDYQKMIGRRLRLCFNYHREIKMYEYIFI